MPGQPGAITIEHVAAAAGVSRQTVSRVINNGANVKPAVRERVQAAIDALHYVPNMAARRMGGSRSYLILAINDRARTLANWQAGRGNDWVDQMLHGAIMACERNGYRMLFELVETGSTRAVTQLRSALSSVRPDGVILTPPHGESPELAALLTASGTAFARLGSNGADDGFNVFMDDAAAAAAATRHLIDLGHRRIGFIAGSTGYGATGARANGYRAALAAAGVAADPALVQAGDFSFESGVAASEALLALAERPSAIIASNDEMAFSVLHVADRHGLSVPVDLSVVSFDDTPGVRFSVPPLTAIRQPIAAMAATATEMLIAAKAGGDVAPAPPVPFELIVRNTTGPFLGG